LIVDEASYAQNNLPESLMVVVGDLSADHHTSKLISKLKAAKPNLNIWGLGSSQMRESGVEILFDCKDFSSIGILGVVKVIPFLARVRHTLLSEMEKRQPKAVLLVDYGGFNLVLAKAIRKKYKKLPIYYFISPQVWGSRPWRLKTIAQTVSKMLVIFPFEEVIYKSSGIPVKFVGHPLTKNVPEGSALPTRAEFCQLHGLDPASSLIAVFPGSRKNEIKNFLPVLIDAIKRLLRERSEIQFAISRANEDLGIAIEERLRKDLGDRGYIDKVKLINSLENYSLMSACDLVWAKSGTTALEVTLLGKPMLIFYRGDWLSYLIFLAFKRVRRVSWPNLLAGKALVPELIQLDCRADQLVKYTKDLLDVPALRQEISDELLTLRNQLGEGDYAQNCAVELMEVLGSSENSLNNQTKERTGGQGAIA